MADRSTCRDDYLDYQQQCRDAVHRGDIQAAQTLADRAMDVARHSADIDLLHRATTNRSMVLLEAGELQTAEKGLREVLLQSSDDEVQCRAAFYLASSLRRQRRIGKAQKFACKAKDKAMALGQPVWSARCLNLLGNIYLNQGNHEDALAEYRQALELWRGLDGDHRFATAIVLDNLGYCLTLTDRTDEGIPYIREALDLAVEIGDRRTEAECRQDLAHALLNRGDTGPAREYALAALIVAESAGYRDILQNCYYVLGQLAAVDGDVEQSDEYFDRLQAFFPDFPHLREFLRLFDISHILTFH